MKTNKIILESDYNEMFDSLISKSFQHTKTSYCVFGTYGVTIYTKKGMKHINNWKSLSYNDLCKKFDEQNFKQFNCFLTKIIWQPQLNTLSLYKQLEITNMKELRFEIKNVKTFEGEEGMGLVCDLFINGTKCCHCIDSAYGGEMNIHNVSNSDKVKDLVKQMYDYCNNKPKIKVRDIEFPYTVESLINDLYNDKQIEKAKKQMLKKRENAIIVGKKDDYFDYSFFNSRKPIKEIPTRILQNIIDEQVKPKLEKGQIILNTNIPDININ